MKKLLSLIGLITFSVCVLSFAECDNPPKTLSAAFLKGTWTCHQHGVNYGFIGKNTMLISDSIEGEEYHYIIKNDTIIFRMLLDEECNYAEFDTMTYSVIDNNTINLNYQGLGITIERDIKP